MFHIPVEVREAHTPVDSNVDPTAGYEHQTVDPAGENLDHADQSVHLLADRNSVDIVLVRGDVDPADKRMGLSDGRTNRIDGHLAGARFLVDVPDDRTAVRDIRADLTAEH